MKIPKTSVVFPYIEFRFNKKGKLTLSTTNDWWGGKSHGFVSSDGYEGNTCPPQELDTYIQAFKERKVKAIEKEIRLLQKKSDILKSYSFPDNF
jgi:hypothetical protein